MIAFVLVAAVPGTAGASARGDITGSDTSLQADFNRDGYHDLAVGVPGENDHGTVHVIYGTANGLNGGSPVDDQVLEWGVGSCSYGSALAWGDFDLDGYQDLAVGDPCFEVFGLERAGLVEVWYGSSTGLNPARRTWHIDDRFGAVEAEDFYGWSLAAANFGNGPQVDLAIGIPFEDFGSSLLVQENAGAVHVLYGSPTGLTATGTQKWSQGSARGGLKGIRESDDRFGYSLVGANFGRGAAADLAVGAPSEDFPGAGDAGAVNVIYGSSAGLRVDNNRFFKQATPMSGDGFGTALAAGDLSDAPTADLAISIPWKEVDGKQNAGAVIVLYGTGPNGLTTDGSQRWTQNSTGVGDSSEGHDYFGYSLAIADFGRLNTMDLAIGVPGEDIQRTGDDAEDGGAVQVLYTTEDGVTGTGSQFWSQDSYGIQGVPEDDCPVIIDSLPVGDSFGYSLAAANFGHSGHADLAVGVPYEDREELGFCADTDAGAVQVIYGTETGLSEVDDQFWWQDGDALKGDTEENDRFGVALR